MMRAKQMCGFAVLVASAFFTPGNAMAAGASDSRLAAAVRDGDKPLVQSLLRESSRAAVNIPDAEGMTALNWAAYAGDLDTVKRLIAAGADVNMANRGGGTPLHHACNFDDAALVETLLNAGADANAVRGEGDTPLLIAAHVGNPDVAKVLLAHGAKVDARDGWLGETPLMLAVVENRAEFAKVLLDHGADVNAVSTHFDFNHRRLVDATAGIDPVMGGFTPLLFAARQGAEESAKVLIAGGADLNKTDPEYEFTPLMMSLFNMHTDFAKLLIDSGAKVDSNSLYIVTNIRINTGEHRIVPSSFSQDSLDMISLLIAHGADPNAGFRKKFPPGEGHARRAPIAGATPFYQAARELDLPAMRLLLEKGAKATVPARDGTTTLMAVINAGTAEGSAGGIDTERLPEVLEAMKICLDNGVDVNTVSGGGGGGFTGGGGGGGNTALHYAAGLGADTLVQYLVDHGAKMDVKNKKGHTPLQWAQGSRPGGFQNLDETGQTPYPSTVALLTKLMSASEKTTAQNSEPAK